jgi:hypothetical protein
MEVLVPTMDNSGEIIFVGLEKNGFHICPIIYLFMTPKGTTRTLRNLPFSRSPTFYETIYILNPMGLLCRLFNFTRWKVRARRLGLSAREISEAEHLFYSHVE